LEGEKVFMESIEKTIEVDAPLSTVYNQWTQFEEFPRFMEGVKEVRQLDDKRLHWMAEIAGKCKEWDAEIFEQIPDETIAWRSMTGAKNSGQVSFAPAGNNGTRVCLKLNYDPEGALENVGDALGVVGRRVEGDLERFKKFIEARRHETGAWRGEIYKREVNPDPKDQGRAPGGTSKLPTPGYGSTGTSGLSGSTGSTGGVG
jgi:uncharacterized membrane protein